MDQLLNPKYGFDYHAVCPECKNYVGKFDYTDRFKRCVTCNNNISLKIPTYNEYFVLINSDDNSVTNKRKF